MSETYTPTGTKGTALKRATSGEAATGTHGDEFMRTNITVIADKIRRLNDSGDLLYIGDDANTFATLGLTINQAGNDDEVLALKSSDVAHGMTDVAETDTFGVAKKAVAASGGLLIRGYTESVIGLQIEGACVSEGATRSTAGTAALYLNGLLKATATVGPLSADQNLAAIGNNGTTRFIFDTDGDFHADSSSTTF